MFKDLQNVIFRLALITNPVIDLKNYLTMSDANKGKEVAFFYPGAFVKWILNYGWKSLPEDQEEAITEELAANKDDDSALLDIIENLDPSIFEEYYKDLPKLNYDITTDPDAPTFLFMDYMETLKNQWLIHFTSNDAMWGIESEGFSKGTPDFGRLGLTTWFLDDSKSGGYNFAYDVLDFARYGQSSYADSGWKYGDAVVMFRASGIKVWHHGDQEPQVIFWGETANSIVVIREYDGMWSLGEGKSGRPVYANEDLEKVVDWVEANYNQYKSVL